ncbi:glycosyltransferase [Salegentibacter salegens]|uniref:Glycosyltransferase involved in cell wall bisynthesis n=1 Tax=Salegentibacter salegens TaxID=143223 RepID=A0A1M7LFN1_9FLAO|nr:glycosyltransferase [Salegentibacter salegens]PRX50648.1 glycosyltransferase involved in cell wall biosynthesis [Salegentibacter salegens]SHM76945.1 Glycosyltransferase involved in cell wall bisynthesis [Salegentibacter salegens]
MEKVLIITYYWPPAGGPGVQRWLKFVKYLRDYGIEPVVFIPENPNYPMLDDSLESEIPEGITILKKPILEPYQLAGFLAKNQTKTISKGIIAAEKNQSLLQKSLLFIRGNLFIPDARKFWIKPSVKFLKTYLEEEGIKKIITTGPPHSLHLIGLKLKKELDLKWIADFRDPWTQIGYHKKLKLTENSKQKHIGLEREVLNAADQIITTSFTTKAEFAEKTRKPISVITNGFDADENKAQTSKLDTKFSISHIGSLLSERNPKNLWKAIAKLTKENSAFAEDLELKLAGTVSEEIITSIKSVGLGEKLQLLGYVSHKQAIVLQQKSRLLLLIEIDSQETRGIIPGKLFEYLMAKRPILAIGPQKWDVEQILKESGSGEYFQYSEKDRLKSLILTHYEAYKRGESNFVTGDMQQYHRKNLTQKLSNLLKSV